MADHDPTTPAPDDKARDRAGDKPRDKAVDKAAGQGKVEVGRATTPLSQQVGRVAFFVAGAIFVLFALFNWQYVDFNWVFGGTEVITAGKDRVSGGVPLIVLLLAAFGLGIVVGLGSAARRRKRKG